MTKKTKKILFVVALAIVLVAVIVILISMVVIIAIISNKPIEVDRTPK